jgi:hypothetical protein
MSIFTLARDVVEIPGDHQNRDETICIPAPEAGEVMEFALFFVAPSEHITDVSQLLLADGGPARLLGGIPLPRGRTLIVWAITRRGSNIIERLMQDERTKARRELGAKDWSLDPSTGPRTRVCRQLDNGPIVVWDLALAPSTAHPQAP